MSTYWEIEEGKVDSTKFFESISKHFSFATTFFAEGTSVSHDVNECYERHREDGSYLPKAQTIFPISKKFRCKCSPDLLADLASLANKHAEPELLDHLVLYKGQEEILLWHDAFANVLLVSRQVPENIVSAFAAELGLRYGRMNDEQYFQIAEDAFRKISEQFPSLEMKRNPSDPVELSIDIPVQPGLKYRINLNLQNRDELHFSVGNFWLEWFPCSEPSTVEAYVDAVTGFLAGRYRVMEHYRGHKCVKAELQKGAGDDKWETIGTRTMLAFPLPWRERHFKILIND